MNWGTLNITTVASFLLGVFVSAGLFSHIVIRKMILPLLHALKDLLDHQNKIKNETLKSLDGIIELVKNK